VRCPPASARFCSSSFALCLAAPAQARVRDSDMDGLSNHNERLAHTPAPCRSDRDGIGDAHEDYDHDGVDNRTEQLARTNPAKRDSNHNRVPDGREDPDHDRMTTTWSPCSA